MKKRPSRTDLHSENDINCPSNTCLQITGVLYTEIYKAWTLEKKERLRHGS